MGHKETIISYITENSGSYCDDCLSKLCSVSPRQTIFQVCTRLNINGKINRETGTCCYCGSKKKVNSIFLRTYNNYVNIGSIKQIEIDNKKPKPIKENTRFYQQDKKFIEVKLEFESIDIKNTFSRFDAHTLREILIKDKYIKLKDECYQEYKEYMDMKLGLFLIRLKQDNNLFYKKFLNPYGDQHFCKFKMEQTSLAKCKGIYMYKCNEQIKYIGRVKGNFNFYQRINAGYANISPKNCYIDGQATNCHINAIINKVQNQVAFYVMPLEDDEEICLLERKLIKENQPEWNIALK
jgi:hypothetical protein